MSFSTQPDFVSDNISPYLGNLMKINTALDIYPCPILQMHICRNIYQYSIFHM